MALFLDSLSYLQNCDPVSSVSAIMRRSSSLCIHRLLSTLRPRNFFFSDLNTWYCVDANWILRGCYPGDTRYDMKFLPLVKQLKVQFLRMDEDYWLSNYHCMGDLNQEQDYAAERLEELF